MASESRAPFAVFEAKGCSTFLLSTEGTFLYDSIIAYNRRVFCLLDSSPEVSVSESVVYGLQLIARTGHRVRHYEVHV